MKCLLTGAALLTFALLWPPATTTAAEPPLTLLKLPPIPDPEGFAGGFAGVSNHHLLFAGGANFPNKKPWEGGKKVWSEAVFALPLNAVTAAAAADNHTAPAEFHWTAVGRLPQPLGYGVSASFHDEFICVGGSRETEHSATVFAIRLHNHQIQLRSLPALPHPLANHSGTLTGTKLCILGGQRDASALAEPHGWQLDLEQPQNGWLPLPPFPGKPRILAAAGILDGQLLFVGGAALSKDNAGNLIREYLADAWLLDASNHWKQLPSLPTPSVAAPSPLPTIDHHPLLLAGDDGRQVGRLPQTHTGFPKHTFRLLSPAHAWKNAPAFEPAVVTAPVIQTPAASIILSGEIRPGIRSPAVWGLKTTGHALPDNPQQ